MNDVQRLRALLADGTLLHPVSDAIGMVDFANALHDAIGVPNVSLSANAAHVRSLLGEPEHVILVLADGFGMNFVETLHAGAFMRANLAAEMRTVFPSTTPIALTTLATGAWPGAHAVIGWFLQLRQIAAVSTIIAYARTADDKPLSELGVSADTAYPLPSRMGRTNRDALHIMPAKLVGSAYSNYWTGGNAQVGYDAKRPGRAIDAAVKFVRSASRPTFVHIYLPQVDGSAHVMGASHDKTLRAAQNTDRLLGSLANRLPSNARLLVTADHGHLDISTPRKNHVLTADDPILAFCGGALTGDFRAAYADVPAENWDAFKAAIHKRFGGDFLALTASEVEDAGLLGAAPLSDETRRRMQRALLLSTGDAALDCRAALGADTHPPIASHHGGITPAELRIPLVIA